VLLKKEIFNTQRIIRALPPLLFDNNKEALTNIHESYGAKPPWRYRKWIVP
jgi:hypothetical protein